MCSQPMTYYLRCFCIKSNNTNYSIPWTAKLFSPLQYTCSFSRPHIRQVSR